MMRQRVVATNGCFDILHAGHVQLLEAARTLGDALIVAINSDASVTALKGKSRPLNRQAERAAVLSSLSCVDAVCIVDDIRVTRFLQIVRPHFWAKGGDYTMDSLDQDERAAVQSYGGIIRILPLMPGESTTSLIARIKAA